MKKFFSAVVFLLAVGLASRAFATTLVDVPSGHWAEDAVQKLIDSGLIEGYPDGTFKGDRSMTRYEYAMVIARLMDILDKSYCGKDQCGGKPGAPAVAGGKCECPIDPAQIEETKAIVKKLAAEFKDELAALKVQVDENSTRIASLEKKVDNAFIGKLQVKGSIRQRVDVPDTELSNAQFNTFYNYLYGINPATTGLKAGYELVPSLVFTGSAGENVTFSIGLDKYIRNQTTIGSETTMTELDIDHAYADIDFSKNVRELDSLKVRSGYQKVALGPYAMLVDNTGVQSTPGVAVMLAKDVVSVAAFGGLANAGTIAVPAGLGSDVRDVYGAGRIGLDLKFADFGFNYLASGLNKEKGWSADVVAPLLSKSSFLKQIKGEYMTLTDDMNGNSAAVGAKDYSFVLGLDLYKSRKAGVTVSYADIPAVPTLSGVDANPFSEFDSVCPKGLDFAGSANCFNFESGRSIIPAGYEAFGIEASYIVLGDVELGAKAVLGNFAGGNNGGIDLDGSKLPGFGGVSVTKPINADSKFRVEYLQQGRDPILINRVRGELLINF